MPGREMGRRYQQAAHMAYGAVRSGTGSELRHRRAGDHNYI